jgi:hypothetical protein
VILQDRPSVVENRRIPDVEVMEIDMMKEQPVKGTLISQNSQPQPSLDYLGVENLYAHKRFSENKGAKVYYFRGVLHDHSDNVCRKFLGHIRDAMGPTSRLLIHEKLVADVNPTMMATKSDLLMMSVYAAMERSAGQMKNLLESVGFKVLGKHSGVGSSEWHIMEAVLG